MPVGETGRELEIVTYPLSLTAKQWKKLSPEFFVPVCKWNSY